MKQLMVLGTFLAAALAVVSADNWPQWRGPQLNGLSADRQLPVRWSKAENIGWKLALPALSGSTPIVWNDRVYLSIAEGTDLSLWSVNRLTGAVVWKRRLGGGNVRSRKQNMSSPSPVTDGRRIWVMTGTGVVKAFDVEGTELWVRDIQRDYGKFGL